MSYKFGPLGWSGGPEDHPGDLRNFLGVRLDVLLGKSEEFKRCVMAHEMAHERQRNCSSPIRRSVVSLEREAESEALLVSMQGKRGKAPLARRIVATVRPVFAGAGAVFAARPRLMLFVSAVFLSGLVYMRKELPPFYSSPADLFRVKLLAYFSISCFLYKFLSGVHLSWWYKKVNAK